MTNDKETYLWRSPKNYPNAAWLNFRWQERTTDSLTFMTGQPLPFESENKHPDLDYTKKDPNDYDLIFYTDQLPEKWLKYDCLPNNMGGHPPVVNNRVLNLLKKLCPENFQDFPITIRNGNPKLPDFENNDYSLLNVINLVDAIDKQESVIVYSSGVTDIRKMALKDDCLGSVHIARVDIYKPVIIVSTELVSLFKREKVKGIRFLKDWEAYPYTPPEIHLHKLFHDNKKSAKRYFVSLLNDNDDYTIFKNGINNIPPEVIEELIEMTLSRSSFHAEQCAELRELLNNTK